MINGPKILLYVKDTIYFIIFILIILLNVYSTILQLNYWKVLVSLQWYFVSCFNDKWS